MSSLTASSIAAITACELGLRLTPGVPLTLYTPRYAFGAIPWIRPAGVLMRLPAAIMAVVVPCPMKSTGVRSSGLEVSGAPEFCRCT